MCPLAHPSWLISQLPFCLCCRHGKHNIKGNTSLLHRDIQALDDGDVLRRWQVRLN